MPNFRRPNAQTPAGFPHPRWCDLTRCTALPTPTLDEYRDNRRVDYGQHCSAPVPAIGATVTARQSVCPWETSVFLTLADESAPDVYVDIAASELVAALAALGLTGGAR